MLKKQADIIREYVYNHYIGTIKGLKSHVSIRAGDIVKEMASKNIIPYKNCPNVCNALGGQIFQDKYNISLIERSGPLQGFNALFIFKI